MLLFIALVLGVAAASQPQLDGTATASSGAQLLEYLSDTSLGQADPQGVSIFLAGEPSGAVGGRHRSCTLVLFCSAHSSCFAGGAQATQLQTSYRGGVQFGKLAPQHCHTPSRKWRPRAAALQTMWR